MINQQLQHLLWGQSQHQEADEASWRVFSSHTSRLPRYFDCWNRCPRLLRVGWPCQQVSDSSHRSCGNLLPLFEYLPVYPGMIYFISFMVKVVINRNQAIKGDRIRRTTSLACSSFSFLQISLKSFILDLRDKFSVVSD